MWRISDELGDTVGALECPAGGSSSPPQEGWTYWDGEADTPDPTLVVVPLGGHQWCPEVQVSATGEAAREQGKYTGKFLITQDFSAGLPVSSYSV